MRGCPEKQGRGRLGWLAPILWAAENSTCFLEKSDWDREVLGKWLCLQCIEQNVCVCVWCACAKRVVIRLLERSGLSEMGRNGHKCLVNSKI